MNAGDFFQHRIELFALRFVDRVVCIAARHGLIRRNHEHAQLVNIVELRRFGLSRSGHAGQFLIQSKIILDRDGCQRLGFPFDLDSFLRLDSLMQTITPTTASH